jgi:hypothetical protein
MKLRDSHPTDQELLLAADGELSGARAERLHKHLAACWECRTRKQELEGAIAGFVRLHRRTLDPLLPPADGSRALLKARLDQLASSGQTARRHWLELVAWRPRDIPIATVAGVVVCAIIGIAIFMSRGSWRREPMYAGALPVAVPTARLTPGAARSATREEVCAGNHEKNRAVPVSLRRRVFEIYGISGADPKAYEVDYLITPALGGADDIRNLWPQSYSATIWNAHVKDALEDRLHDLVCRGDLDLAAAQRDISTDWIAAYKKYFRTDRPVPASQ